jgi:hypothetical protein
MGSGAIIRVNPTSASLERDLHEQSHQARRIHKRCSCSTRPRHRRSDRRRYRGSSDLDRHRRWCRCNRGPRDRRGRRSRDQRGDHGFTLGQGGTTVRIYPEFHMRYAVSWHPNLTRPCCGFSNRVPCRQWPNSSDTGCLTRCHRALVSNSGHYFLQNSSGNHDGSPAKFGGDVEAHRVLFFCCPQWLADDASIGVGADAQRRQVATLGMR